MTVSLPSIEIIFKQLASNFIQRSERGIAALIIKDDTDSSFNSKEYKSKKELEVDKALYTTDNLKYIEDVLSFGVAKVVVIRVGTTGTVTDALNILEKTVKTGWITTVGLTEDYTTIVNWIKSKEESGQTYKAIVYNATSADCKHIVNFANEKVTFNDTRGEVTGEKYLPSLLGILASCNVEKGSTYFVCNNLLKVQEVANNDTTLNAGKFILINDFDNVKVGLGINSLTTFQGNNSEDMRFIDTVETMDLITDDIKNTFKDDYIGKYKNNLDNQTIFISAVNSYLRSLAKEDILDINYKNYSDVDVVAQREAWMKIKPEAETWDDSKVRNNSFKRTVFLSGDIKILSSMENLKFNISMV